VCKSETDCIGPRRHNLSRCVLVVEYSSTKSFHNRTYWSTWINSDQLGSTQINSDQTRIKSDQLGSTWIKTDPLGSTRINSDQLGTTRINWDHLGSAWINSDQLGSTLINSVVPSRNNSDQLGSTRINSEQLGYPKTPCLWSEGKLSSRADEQAMCQLARWRGYRNRTGHYSYHILENPLLQFCHVKVAKRERKCHRIITCFQST
jgi:hypothetical protein